MTHTTRVTLFSTWAGFMIFALVSFVFWHNQAQLKEFLVRPDGVILKALFSPQDNVKNTLLQIIEHEQKEICATAYIMTDRDIVAELIRAKNERGVKITVVTDFQTATDMQRNYQVRTLCQTVDVYLVQPADNGIMHNKYMLFEKNLDNQQLVWTGSFNFTISAQVRNRENVVISNDIQLYAQYKQAFAQLLKEARPAAPLVGPPSSHKEKSHNRFASRQLWRAA